MTPTVVPLPSQGDVFVDASTPDKALRVSWHHDAAVVVVSLWRADSCVGTLRLTPDEVPRLISALSEGLADAYPEQSTRDRGNRAS
jgi:hypothetical protein